MRYSKYLEMKKKSEVVNPESLSPTERSVYYHSLRVHCKVIALILRLLLCFDVDAHEMKIAMKIVKKRKPRIYCSFPLL